MGAKRSSQNNSCPIRRSYLEHWSTGIGTSSCIMDFMEQIGQKDRRAFSTDEWLRVKDVKNVFALGDCATIHQRRVMILSVNIYYNATKTTSGTINGYPQVELYLKSKHPAQCVDLLRDAGGDE
ncbi:external alternative NADPH-ubiquinone oxidoreductase B1, mitochondrial [Cinnamomum micranthum f. kanehirae]|uniref:NADH:ubiquinone reductase (non-electrogenic) n=1 Tax=Cinnamomum micranthum f. kanehirae TaxID=337451 RepID=A0A443PBE3_9MAGN|nr:external alternative NADPH-ubiquinone oxidoreductase B1, mitochondrial [Cinnamomum micranthum f. kanehirae]